MCECNETETVDTDLVNNPKHYKTVVLLSAVKLERVGKSEYNKACLATAEIDCLDIIDSIGLNKELYVGQAFQYIWRSKKKGNELEDLKKARYYLDREIELREYDIEQARLKKEAVVDEPMKNIHRHNWVNPTINFTYGKQSNY